jgi:hypothetical protein
MLELEQGVSLQIGNISIANTVFGTRHQHPAKVREEEATMSTIRVLVGIGPSTNNETG